MGAKRRRSWTRRRFLRAAGLGATAAAGAAAIEALAPGGLSAAPERPNILFLFTDDQAFRTVNAVNNPDVRTPNIDRLVGRGTTFTHCFIQGSWTGAVCVASRATLLTGRHVWTCGGDKCGKHPLWPETFRAAGYDTFVTGKWHNGPETLKRGFETRGPTGGGMFPSRNPSAKDDKARGIVKDPYGRPSPGNSWSPYDETLEGHWRKAEGGIVHSSKLWADTAVRHLEQRVAGGTRPFFMYVAFHAPHDPRQSPKEYVDMYPPERMKVPPNFLPLHPFDQGDSRIRDEKLAPFPRTEDAVRLHLSEYYAIITHADFHIGRILDALDRTGRARDTIVIFSADNGLAVGQHGLMGKQNMYDHSLRVPLVFGGPGIAAGARSDALVYLPSMFATTCELAGVAAPDTVQLPSLAPLLDGRAREVHGSVYAAYRDLQRMVRTRRHKLIRYPKANEVQLFDIEKDPWETKDLAEDRASAGLVRELDAELRAWMKRAGDPLDPAKTPGLSPA